MPVCLSVYLFICLSSSGDRVSELNSFDCIYCEYPTNAHDSLMNQLNPDGWWYGAEVGDSAN